MNHPALQLAASSNPVADLASPGILGFTVIALIGGALFLLMRSMKGHLDVARSGDFDQRAAGATVPAEKSAEDD
ncbi:hypothetical protein [Actinorugispora endophytica]|uniref:Uncharacterized protein n=1 Tax=Actinorugispora endophytica TaxID=1605990 RepID=A0A4R6V6K6_9ACTN|nr:hypothetical protein [Actinorugispora endophytica]TDQ54822.1 hypothetical protein EV190_101138 [Actinorugispora endophytica]